MATPLDLKIDSSERKPIVIPAWELENRTYVSCPYFPEHEMPRSRLGYHLIKCQKRPDAPKLVVCPFNYLHRIKPEDQIQHVSQCEDKKYFQDIISESPSYGKTLKELGNVAKKGFDVPEGLNLW